MLDFRQRFTYGMTQPYLMIEWPLGRPITSAGADATVTVSFYHPAYEADDSPNPLVDAATATIGIHRDDGTDHDISTVVSTGGAAANARSVAVDDRRNVRGGDCLYIKDAAGQSEYIEVTSVTAGAVNAGTLGLRDPLARAYAAGAKVQTAWVRYQLPSALDTYWADDDEYAAGWRAVWTSGGIVRKSYVDFGLEAVEWHYDTRRLIAHAPDLFGAEPALDAGEKFRDQADAAIRRLRQDLIDKGIPADLLQDLDQFAHLIDEAILAMPNTAKLAYRGMSVENMIAHHERRYQSGLLSATASLRARVDAGQTGLGQRGRARVMLVRGA